jgi:hypothetical protein
MSDGKTESILPDEPFTPITQNPKKKDSPSTSIFRVSDLETAAGELDEWCAFRSHLLPEGVYIRAA